MYDVSPHLDIGPVDSGTNMLIEGPAMSGKRRLALLLLGLGESIDDLFCITTNSQPKKIRGQYNSTTRNPPESVSIIDCCGEKLDSDDELNTLNVERVSSPADMTGIGIKASNMLDESTVSDHSIRLYFDTISTLLMYADTQDVFKFLHVLTNRLTSAGGLGIYTMDTDAVDDSDAAKLRQLFDIIVQLRENGAGNIEYRIRGFEGVSQWEDFTPDTVADNPSA